MQAERAKLALLFGANLRARRLELGMARQRTLYDTMDPKPADTQAISDWERGVRMPSARFIEALVVALKLPDAGWLYRDHGAPPVQDDQPDLLGAMVDRIGDLEASVRQLAILLEKVGLPAPEQEEAVGVLEQGLGVTVSDLADKDRPGKAAGGDAGSDRKRR
jgi:transcriptional regulator with XRE-family HTH domain